MDGIITHHHHEHGLDATQVEMMNQLELNMGPGADEQMRSLGEEGLTRIVLRRWLTARKWHLANATKDLTAHVKWRSETMPSGSIDPADVIESVDENKAFIQGLDYLGHPVTVVYVKRHLPKSYDHILKFICYTLDAAVRLGSQSPTWDGKLTGVLYLTGMTMSNYDVTGLRAIFDALANHYPERLHRLYLYNAPTLFYALWRVVLPFVVCACVY
ncbi:hypothetical protein FOA52_007416 [Chlamydomonas sp. UWO 241]|nr:hypothetical protein FOA52_007416 [Chlamydomonas sp. UWO 241]